MTFILIHLFFTVLSFFWIYLSARESKKRQMISYQLKKGFACYNCKSEIHTMDEVVRDSVLIIKASDEKDYYDMCVQCKRDISIRMLMGSRIDVPKLKRWIIKNPHIYMFLIGVSFIINISSILLPSGLAKQVLSISGILMLNISNIILLYRTRFITIKKTQSD